MLIPKRRQARAEAQWRSQAKAEGGCRAERKHERVLWPDPLRDEDDDVEMARRG